MKQDLIENLKSRNRFLTNLLSEGGYTDYIYFQDYDKNGNVSYKALDYPGLKSYITEHGTTYTDRIFEEVENNNQDIEFMKFIHSKFNDYGEYKPPLSELADFFMVHAEDLIDMWSD